MQFTKRLRDGVRRGTITMTAIVLSAALAVAWISDDGATQARGGAVRPDCSWSQDWEAMRPKADGRSGDIRPPRKRKGTVERVRPNPGERFRFDGPWIVGLVIAPTGRVVDVRVLKHAADPPWPRYEAALVKALRKWEFHPATVDGRPVAVCYTVRLQDR